MSDNNYTEKGQPTFLTLHEVKHALRLIEGVITEQIGEQCLDYDPECFACETWNALHVLVRYVYAPPSRRQFNKAMEERAQKVLNSNIWVENREKEEEK